MTLTLVLAPFSVAASLLSEHIAPTAYKAERVFETRSRSSSGAFGCPAVNLAFLRTMATEKQLQLVRQHMHEARVPSHHDKVRAVLPGH